jgi:hypothetical protein
LNISESSNLSGIYTHSINICFTRKGHTSHKINKKAETTHVYCTYIYKTDMCIVLINWYFNFLCCCVSGLDYWVNLKSCDRSTYRNIFYRDANMKFYARKGNLTAQSKPYVLFGTKSSCSTIYIYIYIYIHTHTEVFWGT